jgi:hypothetical protein
MIRYAKPRGIHQFTTPRKGTRSRLTQPCKSCAERREALRKHLEAVKAAAKRFWYD